MHGNFPAKRLLLTSSSNSNFKFKKLRGRIPQNRFELICNNAISYSSPNSFGRDPAMLAWLISMPATVRCDGQSSALEQKTPV